MENKVKEMRLKLGITQKQLAEKVGTSQQQIQRIENMLQSTRLDLAIKISEALDSKIGIVFPSTGFPLDKALKKAKSIEDIYNNTELQKSLQQLGIDVDLAIHSILVKLKSGLEIIYQLTKSENDRMWNLMQNNNYYPFVSFDSLSTRILLNKSQILYYQFRFDPQYAEEVESEDDEINQVRVYFSHSQTPEEFDVEADDAFEEDSEEIGQFSHLIMMAENIDEKDQLSFLDINGERVFLIAEHVAMIEIPLYVVEPKLLEHDDEEDDEE